MKIVMGLWTQNLIVENIPKISNGVAVRKMAIVVDAERMNIRGSHRRDAFDVGSGIGRARMLNPNIGILTQVSYCPPDHRSW